MGIFDRVFGRRPKEIDSSSWFQTLSGYTPVFTSWGGKLYENELVRSAIDARARHISKMSVTFNGTAKPKIKNALKNAPNEFQTWTQFLYRLSTILDMQNTAFIIPIYDDFGEIKGIYPLLPSQCELIQSTTGVPYIRYTFRNGNKAAMELSATGIMTKFQYNDDMFGDNNNALTPTMSLINIQNQGITEGVKSAATYRFMARMSNFMKPEDLKKERKAFTKANLSGDGGGMLLFPNQYTDIKQIDSKPFVVDAEQMKIIQTNVYNYYGVNEDVLQNKASGDSWSAFYEGALEPFAIQFSEVISKMLFTKNEMSIGSNLMLTSNRLQYMTNKEKLEVSAQMADRGIMNRDEIREIWNLPPLPNGEGQAYIIRGEYYTFDGNKPREEENNGENN